MPNLINRILKVFIFFHVVYALLWWQFTTTNFLEVESQTLAECGISSGSKLMIQTQDPAQAAARHRA